MHKYADELAYSIKSIGDFLNETGGLKDWDFYTGASLNNIVLNDIRVKARAIDLPIDEDGRQDLLDLLEELIRL